MPHKFRELKVWQKAMDLAVDVRRFSQEFPKDEQFILTSQIRRAANSVPLNIAEGAGCRTDAEFAQFVGVAYRSCNEVMTAAELAVRLGYVAREMADSLVTEVDELGGMLIGLTRSLSKK
jgi:four helix bundle protein